MNKSKEVSNHIVKIINTKLQAIILNVKQIALTLRPPLSREPLRELF
jgi:hypothetical protein